MTNKEKLEKYLQPFLLDEDNNGKTIMLSGAWGAGKTHFWREEIEREQKKVLKDNKEVDKYTKEEYEQGLHSQLKDKACVYVSLYGKDSLDTLKKEIYIKASSEKELLSKEVSTFGFDALSSIKDSDLKVGQLVKAGVSLYNKHKSDKGIERLKDGGLLCLDDFERKSKQIDLNDLFGFISQLAIEMNCKIVIILNDDVFTGKEAEVFRNVKEKTVNKFLYFEPTIEELFESIFENKKYRVLKDCKENILNAIKETEELNARIYMQVLDNCLEWVKVKRNLDKSIVRVLVLGTFNFVLNHMVLDYQKIIVNSSFSTLKYSVINFYSNHFERYDSFTLNLEDGDSFIDKVNMISVNDFIKKLQKIIYLSRVGNEMYLTDNEQKEHLTWITDNEQKLKALWKYGYKLYYVANVEEKTYNKIAQFIKSGILIDV